jgi:hypothetical protein
MLAAVTVTGEDLASSQEKCRKPENILDCNILDTFGTLTAADVSLDDVERLRLLVRLTQAGRSSGVPADVVQTSANPSSNDAAEKLLQTVVNAGLDSVGHALASQNTATTAPQSSDAQVHASRQNFNVPLSVAVNSVDRAKDEQSLIVRFNKVNAGPLSVGTTATITQPVLFKNIETGIEQAKRSAVADSLSGKLQDTDDITLSLHLAPRTPPCTNEELTAGSCYGRDLTGYEGVLSPVLEGLLLPISGPSATTNKVTGLFFDWARSLIHNKVIPAVKDLSDEQRATLFDFVAATKRFDASDTAKEVAARKKIKLENLAVLIENQPQWTLTFSGQKRDQLVGPNTFAGDLLYERGSVNLNSVVSACKKDVSACIADALQNVKSSSFSFDVSLKQSDSYGFAQLPPGVSDTPVTFTAVSIPRIRTYKVTGQYGFDVLRAQVNDKPTRFDLAGSWSETSGDPKLKHTRFVVGATVTIPLGDAVSLPVTFSYANHEEFLKDTQTKLGVHFGITYRLPFKKPA